MMTGRQGCLRLAYKDCSIKIGAFRLNQRMKLIAQRKFWGIELFSMLLI